MADGQPHLVGKQHRGGSPGRLPPPLRMLCDRAERHFAAHLKAVFEQVDDTFFDLADNADDHRLQTTYFDAMRLIRFARQTIEAAFVREVGGAFQRLLTPGQSQECPPPRRDHSGFELVADDDLEEIIALDTMVSTAEEVCGAPLQRLTARIDSLTDGLVSDKNNPLGPDLLCDAFFKATEPLDIGIRSKLVLLKLFDRHVMAGLSGFLVQSNQLLAELGVLPELEQSSAATPKASAAARRQPQRPVSSFNRRVDGDGRQPDGGRLVAQLNAVLARTQPAAAVPAGSPDTEGAPLDEVLNALTSLQLDSLMAAGDDRGESLLEALTQQLQVNDSAPTLPPAQRGVVQLVDSLFQRARTESGFCHRLEPEMRGLELAIVKVALKDPSFFDRERHPARRLLNEVVQASMGFDSREPVENDPLYQKIHQVLDQLQSVAADDQTLTRLLTDFIGFVEKERRRSAGKEQRLLEEEHAKARLNFSHSAVRQQLDSRLLGVSLPNVTTAFVEQAWGNVLFLAHLREGASSDAWRAAVQILEQMIDLSVRGHEALGLRDAVALLESIRDKLDEVALDPYQTEHLVRGIEQLLQAAVAGAIDKLDHSLVESIYPSIPGQPDRDPDDSGEPLDEALIHDVTSIEKGAWVDFLSPDQGRQRARFAGLVGPGQRLIFVNRNGDKVAEGSRQRMAVALKSQSLVVLDNSPLFDRALAGIVKDVRAGRNPVAATR